MHEKKVKEYEYVNKPNKSAVKHKALLYFVFFNSDFHQSIQLFNFLSSELVGFNELVQIKRHLFAMSDVLNRSTFTRITGGCVGEGLEITGSDLDFMFYNVSHRVEEFSNQTNYIIKMNTNDSKTGYTRLIVYDADLHNLFVKNGDSFYLLSNLYQEHFKSYIHIPCLSDINLESQIDVRATICLHCAKWVTIGKNRITRSRSSWPDCDLKSSVVEQGVLVIPSEAIDYRYKEIE